MQKLFFDLCSPATRPSARITGIPRAIRMIRATNPSARIFGIMPEIGGDRAESRS
jgi:hypothetical protein